MTVFTEKNGIFIKDTDIDLAKTFDCGQCFRFEKDEDGVFMGVAHSKALRLWERDGGVFIEGITEKEFDGLWRQYFDMDRDYGQVTKALSEFGAVAAAAEKGKGIHILLQDPWETLCSFIISQNNNIPRIKKIINALCALLGKELAEGVYAFPTPEAVVAAGIKGLAPIRSGFRAKYIIDAAEKVVGGLDLEALRTASYEEAIAALCMVKGVGPKVANCVALFGLGHTEAFPVDVWIKRVMDKYFDKDFSPSVFGKNAGIAQQYLFYAERYLS